MLGDVTTQVSDGLLGFAAEKGTGTFVAIGVSPTVTDVPITISGNMKVDKIKGLLGLSPLADSVMDSVENGANRIYCIPVRTTNKGTVTAPEKTGDGTGSCTVQGDPNNAYEVVIDITGNGGLNSALFTYSSDGGFSHSEEMTIPSTGEFLIPNTGVTIKFTEDSEKHESSFQYGDKYLFQTTEPKMTNEEVLAAVSKLKSFNSVYEFVHIVGESSPAIWSAVSAAQAELESNYHKPLLFVLEAGKIGADESVEDYALRLKTERKQIKNKAVQVVVTRSLYVKMDGVTKEINNAGIVCGLYAKTNVQKSIGRTDDSYKMGIKKSKMIELMPPGIKEYTELLDESGFLTFREYDGLNNFYVSNARVMSQEGSDYRYAEDVRVLYKIIREVRKAALPLLQDDIDVTDIQGELERKAKFMEAPLDEMVRNKEISAAEITVPDGQDIITDETMNVVIRYNSRGYIRNIVIDLGRANVVGSAE